MCMGAAVISELCKYTIISKTHSHRRLYPLKYTYSHTHTHLLIRHHKRPLGQTAVRPRISAPIFLPALFSMSCYFNTTAHPIYYCCRLILVFNKLSKVMMFTHLVFN